MIIYKDIVSGDELFTDIYKITLINDVLYEVEGKLVTEKTKVDDAMIGGNKSAEDGGEADEDSSAITGVNIVLANRLVETGFVKKDYQKYLKEYMKKIIEHLQESNPERIATFKAMAQLETKRILGLFGDLQFFMGESMNPDAMHPLVIYKGETPYVYFWKDGLEEEKV